ncbi:D-alanyl-D-alanine carboxypeptidase/D-alanyl-D-alanine-endopeptidase [Bacillus sp. HMF5848]|uniref:D-alanyl-D-alanine carboxypeptidase/D-alanyl-D-alanine endopeptidase n=1 Tax=Bacillus sp. HMF5848 TaxID=2495421 RepID=UPI000F77CCD4|nr:D-alanyl-D-alanine carboxypeptidase/D-alanyl-D-alanine-endopeptidase [Bacillus sp. HMF5848]RSK27643.1 D-alanyl-D-alanine carboxypeptidase/D-alanyl-D-alanine-endopeptidase [Bacillus sp. HMF5848]
MKLKLLLHVCVILAISFLPYMTVEAPHAKESISIEQLTTQLTQLVENEPLLKGATIGISVRHAFSGDVLYARNSNVRLTPASNMKLFTAQAALQLLGENYRFTTEVLTDGHVKKGTLYGNVFLKGKGDPTLLQTDLETIVETLQKAGIEKIEGNVIGDDSWFDDVRHSIDLPWSDEQEYYGAGVSALSLAPDSDYDTGTVLLEVMPNKKVGGKARVTVTPKTKYVTIQNDIKTVAAEEEKDITVERKHGTNVITLSGTIPVNARKDKEWVAVWEPTLYAVDVFHESLTGHGIEVSGNERRGTTPKNATLLAEHHSMPLKELLIPFMKLSNNVHAEVLVKEMGKVKAGEGSWNQGLAVMKHELQALGIDVNTLITRDGSGISHVNAIPANEISRLLFVAQQQKWFPAFQSSLPVSGFHEKMVGGTLRYRLTDPSAIGRVYAKTGTLTSVSSLAGYVKTDSGEDLIFSIVLNGLLDEWEGKNLEDKIVMALLKM